MGEFDTGDGKKADGTAWHERDHHAQRGRGRRSGGALQNLRPAGVSEPPLTGRLAVREAGNVRKPGHGHAQGRFEEVEPRMIDRLE